MGGRLIAPRGCRSPEAVNILCCMARRIIMAERVQAAPQPTEKARGYSDGSRCLIPEQPAKHTQRWDDPGLSNHTESQYPPWEWRAQDLPGSPGCEECKAGRAVPRAALGVAHSWVHAARQAGGAPKGGSGALGTGHKCGIRTWRKLRTSPGTVLSPEQTGQLSVPVGANWPYLTGYAEPPTWQHAPMEREPRAQRRPPLREGEAPVKQGLHAR